MQAKPVLETIESCRRARHAQFIGVGSCARPHAVRADGRTNGDAELKASKHEDESCCDLSEDTSARSTPSDRAGYNQQRSDPAEGCCRGWARFFEYTLFLYQQSSKRPELAKEAQCRRTHVSSTSPLPGVLVCVSRLRFCTRRCGIGGVA